MKKILEDPKKKIFMLYPRFLQMILDEKHPELVKGPNYINLKPMGPGCFDKAYRFKRAKQHNFVGKFDLEKHGRFTDIVPAAPVAPAPPQINAQIAEEHDVQHIQQVAGKEDEQFNVGRPEQTPEERAAAHAAVEAEREAALEAYLATKPKKRSSKPKKQKQSNKQMLVMKNQDMNPLYENFQLKDPTKRPDRYVIGLGLSFYDQVGNKSEVACWRYEHDKKMWLITRKSGYRQYYAQEAQFESWTKIDLKSLLRAPLYDPEPNQRGRGWAFHARLEKEVKTNFATMKNAESEIRRNLGVRDPFIKRTVKSVIWPPTDKEKIIPLHHKFEKVILRNLKFWTYDPKMAEAMIVTQEQSIRILNSYDLMSFHEEDIVVLSNHQIHCNEKYEACGKEWTTAAANILRHRLFAEPVPNLGVLKLDAATNPINLWGDY
ncbi:hypothetical protein HanHA89_Chr02g0055671 [Helianthus annuus]|nr:hypothetical protein HanHA89_Chr02g0055671 [Helianthus annuus]